MSNRLSTMSLLCALLMMSATGFAAELIWWGPPGPLMQEIGDVIIADYQKLHPDQQIQLMGLGQSTEQKPEVLITQIASGVAPDMVFVQNADVAWWATQGLLQPLDNMAAAAGFRADEFIPGAWESMKMDGVLYALPLVIEPFGLVWAHETLLVSGFDPTKPPASWDDLTRTAKRITRVEGDITTRFGANFSIGGVNTTASTALTLAAQLGLPVADANGVYLNRPEWIELLGRQLEVEKEQGGKVAWDSYAKTLGGPRFGNLIGGWANGSFGFSFTGPWAINQVATLNPDAVLGISPMPLLPGGKLAVTSKGWSIAIPTGAKHAKEAMQFLRYLMSRGPLEKWYKYQSSFPAHMSSLRYLLTDVLHQLNSPQQRMAFANLAMMVNVATPPPSPVAQLTMRRIDNAITRMRNNENPAAVLEDISRQLSNDLELLKQKK